LQAGGIAKIGLSQKIDALEVYRGIEASFPKSDSALKSGAGEQE